MTFREAFWHAAQQNRKVRIRRRLLDRIAAADAEEPRFKRLWERMEDKAKARYMEDTGRTVTDFGDGQFLDWLVENLPKILEIVMTILALFGV